MREFKYFHASAAGSPPVMAPAGFRISLLDYMPVDMAVADRGLIQLRYDCVYKFTINIGFAKRFQSNSTMLRVMSVSTQVGPDEHHRTGMVLEGDPMGDTFGAFDRNPDAIIQQMGERPSAELDSCYRLLAGLLNAMRALGIVRKGNNNIPYKRLLGFLSSPIMVAVLGTFIEDPIEGFKTFMATVAEATGERSEPTNLTQMYLDRYYTGWESGSMTFLNLFSNRLGTIAAWKLMRDAGRKPSDIDVDTAHDLRLVDQIGNHFIYGPNGRIDIDRMSSIKALDALLRQDRSMLDAWVRFIASILAMKKEYNIIGIPIGRGDRLTFLIGPHMWSKMFSSLKENYNPIPMWDLDDLGVVTPREMITDVGNHTPGSCDIALPE